jgi:hypothetical protein
MRAAVLHEHGAAPRCGDFPDPREAGCASIGVAARFARHLQVGNLAGLEVTLPARALRSISLDLRGFSIAHPPPDVRREGYLRLTCHVARGDIAVLLPPRKEPAP